ncbi:MAG: YkgJ family cysteine cluster protein [Paludibacteraceae bacterium]
MLDIKDLPGLTSVKKTEWKKYYVKNKKKLSGMDTIIHQIHNKISDKTDCLKCANCCRTLGPRILDKDVARMAKALRMSTNDVVEKYLLIDEDNDLIFKTMPCPFLDNDNYCSIYENRPKACREYPHTDSRKFVQIYMLTVKNAETCPIAYEVMAEMQQL